MDFPVSHQALRTFKESLLKHVDTEGYVGAEETSFPTRLPYGPPLMPLGRAQPGTVLLSVPHTRQLYNTVPASSIYRWVVCPTKGASLPHHYPLPNSPAPPPLGRPWLWPMRTQVMPGLPVALSG